MSLLGHTAIVGERTGACIIFVGKPSRGHFKDIFVGENLILKWINEIM
jgi:hypothetical protein